MEKFMKAIDDVITFILGDKRSGDERRVKKSERKKKLQNLGYWL